MTTTAAADDDRAIQPTPHDLRREMVETVKRFVEREVEPVASVVFGLSPRTLPVHVFPLPLQPTTEGVPPPFVEPATVERFRFSREWMRDQFNRVSDPRQPGGTMALKINLPPQFLLIHRVWLGGIGVLSQLGAEAPFRAILTESLPGFAPPAI